MFTEIIKKILHTKTRHSVIVHRRPRDMRNDTAMNGSGEGNNTKNDIVKHNFMLKDEMDEMDVRGCGSVLLSRKMNTQYTHTRTTFLWQCNLFFFPFLLHAGHTMQVHVAIDGIFALFRTIAITSDLASDDAK